MKPKLLKMSRDILNSFSIRQDKVPYFLKSWHYHSEIELVRIEKGKGTQFVGNNIYRFEEGDLFLIGSNLPHCWRCDEIYYKNNPEVLAEAKVVHFLENCWGEQFLDLPENKNLKNLLIEARAGLKILGKTNIEVSKILEKLIHAKNTTRIILILQALDILSQSNEIEILSSPVFNYNEDIQAQKINDVFNFTMINFYRKITLEEVAEVANISPTAFCRLFKSVTKKTYSQFLNEVRIRQACKLLIEDKKNINYICHETGYNNFSNFNARFKEITGKSPLQYRKTFLH
ncbi:AraC family transcriptional regulator [Dyadobacter sp. CY347]|uniref:AraC family transcriptional regulator n=1 Tax=Dyadobacter sp. CY347 TaxID=2909336 RepID=UPI001F1BC37B|nr:helix-turn-helix domain-containing protein [Dyadobacter sp. CY347]MCF2491600.1 helix-turn-helix domain-containing protein [Dyadobacter sp. CY347]